MTTVSIEDYTNHALALERLAADAFRRPSRWTFTIVDPDPAAVDGGGDRDVLATVTILTGDTAAETAVQRYFDAAIRQAVGAATVEVAEARAVYDFNQAKAPEEPAKLHATQASLVSARTTVVDQGSNIKAYTVQNPADDGELLTAMVAPATATPAIDALIVPLDDVRDSLSTLAQAISF